MTALTPAFDAANLISLFYKIVKCSYASLPDNASNKIKELVSVILQANPEKRPTAHELLSHRVLSECIDEVSNVLAEAGINLPSVVKENAKLTNGKVEKIKQLPRLNNGDNENFISKKFNHSFKMSNDRDTQDTLVGETAHCRTPTNGVQKLVYNETKKKKNNKTSRQHFPPARSNSVFETPRDDPVSMSLNLQETEREEVDDERPQTCPNSAVSRYNGTKEIVCDIFV